ncbi:RNA-directed DNA polymerase, eukaryota, reverse transcriptase zinc-binding domain protein [Tanacetum coccineum]
MGAVYGTPKRGVGVASMGVMRFELLMTSKSGDEVDLRFDYLCGSSCLLRSVEDEVVRVSTSVFVTNFPKQSGAKELWNACKQYGHVVDAFIPNRRSKIGKRFQRPTGHNSSKHFGHNGVNRRNTYEEKSDNGKKENYNSYAHVVKGLSQVNRDTDNNPTMVIDDDCVNQEDYMCCLNGKVKDFGSLSNMKIVLGNEGFNDIEIRYLGGLWVMIVFKSVEVKEKFKSNVGTGSWFSQLIQTSNDFIVDGRVTWVEIEGIPLKVWTENTFKRIVSKWGSLLSVDTSDKDCFHSKRLSKEVPSWYPDFDEQHDEDSESEDVNFGGEYKADIGNSDEEFESENEVNIVPDTVFEDANDKPTKKRENDKDSSTNESLKYPPGFTPSMEAEVNSNMVNQENNCDRANGVESKQCADLKAGVENTHSKREGLTQKAKKDWVKELCVSNKVNFLTLQETKMESIELFDIKRCWGNFVFDYVYSNSVGSSGGILCVWDTNSFKKINATISDYFIMIRGNRVSNGKLLLVISVYAPQELIEKKMLWDYLGHVIDSWKGEVIIMGDFNDVRYKNERFGSNFNVQGATAFNSFIVNDGLEEVPLGGYAFTWCHKSASKMSKLDRLLISESLLSVCLNFSAITLDRFLSDHRLILLRESTYDYGPIPFQFFHYWLEVDGFKKLVIDVWHDTFDDGPNDMLNLMNKLKNLKKKIRIL